MTTQVESVRAPEWSSMAVAAAVLLMATPALGAGFEAPKPHLEWWGASNTPTLPTGADGAQETRQEATAELSLEERRAIQAQLKLRRKMVQAHQVLAFVTAGSIVAADVLGLINETAFEKGTPNREQLEGSLIAHRVLVTTAVSSYLSAGILAWTMPKAYQRATVTKQKKKADSGDIHVALSVLHGIAMGTVVATGLLQATVATGEAWEALVAVHGIAGITAASGVIGAGIVIGTL